MRREADDITDPVIVCIVGVGQMRREADDIGPRAELDHWKKRMSRFNYLLEQIKGDDVKVVLGVLTVARSKTLKVHTLSFIVHDKCEKFFCHEFNYSKV